MKRFRTLLLFLLGHLVFFQSFSQTGQQCFVHCNNDPRVSARVNYTINQAAGTVTIRATLARTFVDNTYGSNTIGWPAGNHKFHHFVNSDMLQLALYNKNNQKSLEFRMDYIEPNASAPSGYKTSGVTGRDGEMLTGNASDIVSVRTSLSENLAICPSYTENSPATNANYTPNPACPNWDWDVWYEVTVKLSAFGSSGFGKAGMTGLHSSPSKTGNDSECLKETTCVGTTKLRLGNQVWNDRDGDGKRDTNEPGIPGATISLYTDNNSDNLPDGAAIKTTMSDSLGRYLFTDLDPGRYIASMPILPGYQQSPNTSTQATSPFPDNNIDNDNNLVRRVGANGPGGIVYTNAITLSANQEPTSDGDDANGNLTFDLAECGNAFIGDFVWNDLNGNGIQDAGEPGINGVLVTITFSDGTTATETTHTYNAPNNQNAPQYDGYYDFKNLGPGTYKITFAKPSGFNASPANVGNDAKDSDPVNGGPVTVTLTANQSNFTIDAGFTKFTPPPSNLRLGNQVWNDRDGDGKRDTNEPGIPGALISLYTDNNSDNLPDGAAIRTTTSDSLGHYLFTNLAPGRYIASMPILPGYQQSPNNTTGGIVGAPKPGCCSLNPDADLDNDNNLVRLVGPNAPGGIVYTNAITLSAGQEPTTDGDDANGNLTFDLAECGNSFIGDFVWNDLNGNGIQDAGEPGINGVLVTITFSDGTIATEETHTYNAPNNQNAPQYDGYYDFENLGPGTYKITFATPPGLHASPANQGGNDAKDSDPVNGGPVFVTIAANESNFTIDAGFTNVTPPPPPPPTTCPNLSLGNMVFKDANGNGKRDAGEQGIGGLTVKLYTDKDGNNVPDSAAISTIMTAADGTYYFGNLAEGKYIVGVTIDSTYSQGPNGDTNPNNNEDDDNNGIRTVNGQVFSNFITLTPGAEPINDGSDSNSNLTLDFGLKMVATTPPPCTDHCDCRNDCNHTGCGHKNCGHNNCKNDCNHNGCGHPNCGHGNCKNDCNHTGCGHPNCSHNSCKNNCNHTGCGHPNCGHNSCKNDCNHTTCGHPNCSHNSCKNTCNHTGCGHSNCGHGNCKNDCNHTSCGHSNCSHNSCKNNCNHTGCGHPNCGHNSCKNDCNHTTCGHPNCSHNSCKNDCKHTDCGHKNCSHNSCKNDCNHTTCGHSNCSHNSCKNDCRHTDCGHKNCGKKAGGQSRVAVSVETPEVSSTSVSVFPNPANSYITVKVIAVKAGTGAVRLTDATGKIVATKNATLSKGLNLIKFDKLDGLKSGSYNVQLNFNYHVYNEHLVLLK